MPEIPDSGPFTNLGTAHAIRDTLASCWTPGELPYRVWIEYVKDRCNLNWQRKTAPCPPMASLLRRVLLMTVMYEVRKTMTNDREYHRDKSARKRRDATPHNLCCYRTALVSLGTFTIPARFSTIFYSRLNMLFSRRAAITGYMGCTAERCMNNPILFILMMITDYHTSLYPRETAGADVLKRC